ncbi:MAG: T9SS type A sorting domain-containing protein, partial [Bacteroidota bacterium]
SDPENIELLDSYRPKDTEGLGVIPHNTHYYNGWLVTSYYTDGVKIIDAHRPSNLIEVGSYDTFEGPDGGFAGCWGTTPFLPSGNVLGSDISNGLFVLKPDYKRASYLEGIVRDLVTRAPIMDATVSIIDDFVNEVDTRFDGSYETGLAKEGTFSVLFHHPEYFDTIIEVSLLTAGILEIETFMRPLPKYIIKGGVIDKTTGQGIPNAKVEINKEFLQVNIVTDELGNFTQEYVQGNIDIVSAQWGYEFNLMELDLNSGTDLIIEMDPGFEDNFYFDLGWEVGGIDTIRGIWERGEPIATVRRNRFANPGFDSDDYGNRAWVTGNLGGSSRFDDLDGGPTILTSPVMDLTNYNSPILNFSFWIFMEAGNQEINEGFRFGIQSKNEKVYLDTFRVSRTQWSDIAYTMDEFITISDSVVVFFEAEDQKYETLDFVSEMGIDNFLITEGDPTNVEEISLQELGVEIFPNPISDKINITSSNTELLNQPLAIRVANTLGQDILAMEVEHFSGNYIIPTQHLDAGIYFIQIHQSNRKTKSLKLMKLQ